MIYQVLSHELRLATYDELQSIYDVADLYDLLEIMDVHDEMADIARLKHKLENGNK